MSKKMGVYKLVAKNGELYIGSTTNLCARKCNHFYTLKKGIHHNPLMQAYANEHGAHAFVFEVIENCYEAELLNREQYYIDNLNPTFNIAKESRSPNAWEGRKHSKETKEKKSATLAGKEGRPHTEETKTKIANSLKGKQWTIERRINEQNEGLKESHFQRSTSGKCHKRVWGIR